MFGTDHQEKVYICFILEAAKTKYHSKEIHILIKVENKKTRSESICF